ncbi:Pao retrotransposon peptidase family protein, partial [Aphelenchoides avenae]
MALQADDEETEGEVDASSEQEYWSSGQTDYGEDDEDQESHSFNNLTTADHLVMSASSNERTLLMTTELEASNPQDPVQQCTCPVFFDTGSTTTLITKDLARKLNLPILEEKIATFHGFGDSPAGKKVPCWTVELVIHMRDNTQLKVTAEAVDAFTAPMTAVVSRKEIQRVISRPHLTPPTVVTTPQILVGLDYLNEFDLVRRRKKLANGFFVYDSRVGPMLSGRGKVSWKKGEKQDRPQVNHIFRITVDPRPQDLHTTHIVEQDQLTQAAEKMWKTEAIGIESPEAPKAEENERVLKHFLETLTQTADGRYEVAFPFKEEILEALKAGVKPSLILPHNYQAAFARLNSVWKTYLDNNPQVCESYSKGFAEQLARGIIEECSSELDMEGLTHYLAHHPVFREDKPTKLRIVFDGSARSKPGARSLNDCLLTGPSLLESLIGILLRSRIAPLLVIGDIEKAFLQISIRPQDRNVTRFLWLKDPSKKPSPDNIVVYRYCRVPFGLNASPFLLLATVQAHLNKIDSPLTKEIRSNAYSDNIFLYAHSTEEAVEKYQETKKAFGEAQMNVREFISNCPAFNEAVPEADKAKETKEKTLGHQWCSQRDVWTFALPDPTPYKLNNKLDTTGSTDPELALPEDKEDHRVMLCRKVKKARFLTKRVMLSVIHSLWDPLGQLAPVTLQARLQYQSSFDTDLKWDEQVSEASVRAWEEVT